MSDPRLPLPMRLINGIGRGLGRIGRRPVSLDPDVVLAGARDRTGLIDDGGAPFQARVRRYLHALDHDARLTLMGRVMARRLVDRLLDNHLYARAAIAHQPAGERQPVQRPVFIVGFSRTGTTLLHRLMALTPGLRAPLFWELLRPAPPPGSTEDDRRDAAAKMVTRGARVAPHMQAIHALDADGPEECYFLFQMAFAVPVSAQFDVSSFVEALTDADIAAGYAFHRSVLQLWQGARPTRWVLKAPMHLHTLDALLDAYPDACVIRTHRRLGEVAGSCCSLYENTRRLASDAVDPTAIGRRWLDQWGRAIEHTRAVRAARLPDAQVIDVRYRDLVADPAATLEAIHRRFDLPWDDASRDRIAAALAARPKGRHGKHRYDPARYGLSPATITARFGDYLDAAGVEV